MPPLYIATLACGLRDGSRVVSEISGTGSTLNTILIAGISDSVRNLVWMNSEDGRKNRNRPKMIVPALLKSQDAENEDVEGFDSGADFEAARMRIINGE
ncbi:MAG: DUF5361 domain-containing protein [Lachnospiraceae bacterium]|nr:DUF5361 domain-containing protein [Lachnospiraceae bacterium]